MAFFFFFQAEDGIRDDLVTGVQTCALPISAKRGPSPAETFWIKLCGSSGRNRPERSRSEERRVGKECRSRGSRDHLKKKNESIFGGREIVAKAYGEEQLGLR